MIDEKYVSITFERWENHYKVLDETLRDRNEEISRLRGEKLEDFIKRIDKGAVQGWIDIKNYTSGISSRNIDGTARVFVYIPDVFHLKVEQEVKKRIDRVPYWIRWLFGAI